VSAIKCVAWDLDETVWPGVAIESDELPEPRERVLALLAELERRGIVNSVASRSDPSLLAVLRRHPRLGDRFVAPQVGWEPKCASVRRLAAALNVGLESVALVDEDPFERAEVRHLAPGVLALSLAELEQAMDSAAFTPRALTAEGRDRARMYRDEERRQAAEAGLDGGREEFLRSCRMRLEIRAAGEADLDRLVELAERTHRLNSTARRHGPADVRGWLRDGRRLVVRARLADRFGDYGAVGLAVVERGRAGPGQAAAPDWQVELLAVSCRVEGRGVPATLLCWVMAEARREGAGGVRALYRANGRNVRLAMLLRQLGFRRIGEEGGTAVLRRPLDGGAPAAPAWLAVDAR
jgi:FkbH-like protein